MVCASTCKSGMAINIVDVEKNLNVASLDAISFTSQWLVCTFLACMLGSYGEIPIVNFNIGDWYYIIAHVIMVPPDSQVLFWVGCANTWSSYDINQMFCNISNSLVYFINYIFPWPFMRHVFFSCIFRYGKYGMKKGWTPEKSTSIELRCSYMMCVFLNPYNLSKLLFAKQLVHEQ
jgi:hypothetical protein